MGARLGPLDLRPAAGRLLACCCPNPNPNPNPNPSPNPNPNPNPKQELKTDDEDKGVFWMAWDDFCK